MDCIWNLMDDVFKNLVLMILKRKILLRFPQQNIKFQNHWTMLNALLINLEIMYWFRSEWINPKY